MRSMKTFLLLYVCIFLLGIYMFAYAITSSASEPDMIAFVTSDDPGYQTVIARWSNREYHLKVKGNIKDPENIRKYDDWIEQVMEKEDETVRHH
jgi:hypothetical protein